MQQRELLYLSRADVAAVGLSMAEVIACVEDALREKGLGRAEMPPKPGIHTRPDAFIHAMPAYLPELEAAGLKWIAGYPDNPRQGLPYITGLLVLNDPETGLPLSVMDATWITAMRTGAATAVAAKHLARSDASRIGILGCGVQGRSNLEALLIVLPKVEGVRAYDAVPAHQERYVAEMRERFQIDIEGASRPRDAVEGMDVVVTAGPILRSPQPVIEASWLKKGGLACPLDFDSMLKPELFRGADRLFTDDRGQLAYYRTVGYFGELPEVEGDLGELVTGKRQGRSSSEERIVCVNLGLALEDMVTARRIYDRAREKGIGRSLPL